MSKSAKRWMRRREKHITQRLVRDHLEQQHKREQDHGVEATPGLLVPDQGAMLNAIQHLTGK